MELHGHVSNWCSDWQSKILRPIAVTVKKKGLISHIWGWSSSHQTIRRALNIYIIRIIAIMGWMTYIYIYYIFLVARATIHA